MSTTATNLCRLDEHLSLLLLVALLLNAIQLLKKLHLRLHILVDYVVGVVLQKKDISPPTDIFPPKGATTYLKLLLSVLGNAAQLFD